MAEASFKSLVKRSQDALSNFRPSPAMKYLAHQEPTPDNGRIFIIACADSRVDPTNIFQLQPREAVVLRNAGGRITEDTVRSLEIMGSLINLGLIVVLHHADCGGLFTTDEQIAQRVAVRNPEHAHEIQGKVYGTFKHIGLDESIRIDVAKIRAWSFLPKGVPVVGYAYEDETGKLREVVASA